MKILLQQCKGLPGYKFVLIGNFANGIKWRATWTENVSFLLITDNQQHKTLKIFFSRLFLISILRF